MAEELGFKLKIDGEDGSKSVKSIRQELREAQADIIKLAREFGELSPQALAAAQRVAQLRDEIGDANETAALFDPGQRFAAIGNAVQTLAGGFAAVQGAMGLMGTESEELQQQLLKVQSALALTEGLNAIADAPVHFQRLASVIRNTTLVQRLLNTTMSGFQKAMLSTGIFALVAGLAYLITNFDTVRAAVVKAIPALGNMGGVFERVKEIAYGVGNAIIQYIASPVAAIAKLVQGDFKGALDALKKGFDVTGNYEKGASVARQNAVEAAAQKRLETTVKEKEKELEIIKAKGQESYNAERNLLQLKLKAAQDNAEEQDKLRQQIRVLDAQHSKQVSDKNSEENKKAQDEADKKREEERQKHEAALKEANEILKKYQTEARLLTLDSRQRVIEEIDLKHKEEREKLLAQGRSLIEIDKVIANEKEQALKDFDARKAEEDKRKKDEAFQLELKRIKDQELEKQNAIKQSELDGNINPEQSEDQSLMVTQQALQAEYDLNAKYGYSTLELKSQLLALSLQKQKETNQESLENERQIQEAKFQIAASGVDALSNLTSIVAGEGKKAQAIQKGLALVQIGIDTAKAISSLTAASESNPANGLTFGAAGIAQFITGMVRITGNILNAKRLLSSSGSASSSPSVSSSAPVKPSAPIQNTATLLDRSGINNKGQAQELKAYVVESDVTKVQKRVSGIENAAKF